MNVEKLEKNQELMTKELKTKKTELTQIQDKYRNLLETSKNEFQLLEIKNSNKIQSLEKQIKQLEDERLNLLAQDDQLALDNHIMERLSDL